MLMKKMTTIFFIGVVMFAGRVQGGENEQLALAFKLVEKTKMSDMFVELAESFMEIYFERFEKPGLENQANANPLKKMFNNEVNLGEDELKWMLAEIYATHFTEKELKEILIFFDSPAGNAWLDKRLSIQTEGEQVGLEWGQLLTQRVLKKFEAQYGENF